MRIQSKGWKLLDVQVIPHADQAYETPGDWEFDTAGCLQVRVSLMSPDYVFLIAIHEAIEAWLCRHHGVSETEVTAFDKAFEAAREAGNTDEPGDDPSAPYRREHFFATSIERLIATELGVDWNTYCKAAEPV